MKTLLATAALAVAGYDHEEVHHRRPEADRLDADDRDAQRHRLQDAR